MSVIEYLEALRQHRVIIEHRRMIRYGKVKIHKMHYCIKYVAIQDPVTYIPKSNLT